jgi:hypothetical protein
MAKIETDRLTQGETSSILKKTMAKEAAAPTPATTQPETPIVVTDDNVEELERKFKTLSENDPLYIPLGDALHRYILG